MLEAVPINGELLVFNIMQMTESDVANVIGLLNNSKSKDSMVFAP